MVSWIARIICVLALAICSLQVWAQEAYNQARHFDQEKTQWIAKVMMTIMTVKPGMTRADLLKVFTTEGGISTRYQRTYVFQECPYIKVNVEFVRGKNGFNPGIELSSDVIAKISQPYLQFSVTD
ncbi:MAG: hypothetical protein ABI383_11805 [Acidobacteriaceae bacterium]